TVTVSNDVTAPTLSLIAASGITTNSATISWTTNELADTQVDYGTTTSYGLQTTLNTSLVTSHAQSLAGLAAGTTYHYRVRSADASGNLALSGDQIFVTTQSFDFSMANSGGITAAQGSSGSNTI